MTLPLTIHHAMVELQKARDLLEESAKKCSTKVEKENLSDLSDDLTQVLCRLELTYGELPQERWRTPPDAA